MSTTQPRDNRPVLWGEVVRKIEMAAPAGEVFDFLADTGALISQVPMADRILVSPDRKRGQVFLTVRGLGKVIQISMAVAADSATDKETGLVKIGPDPVMLEKPGAGTVIGRYSAVLRIVPEGVRRSRVLCKIEIGTDLSPLKWVQLVPKAILNGPVQMLYQQRMEAIFDEHLQRLQAFFPRWRENKLDLVK
jgi:hypothetical protein